MGGTIMAKNGYVCVYVCVYLCVCVFMCVCAHARMYPNIHGMRVCVRERECVCVSLHMSCRHVTHEYSSMSNTCDV